MSENTENVPFSPILIMEFIRQSTIGRFLNAENLDMDVKFKISKEYYLQIQNYYIQGQLINLDINYDEASEILSAKTNEKTLNRFHEQKALLEISQKYENQYKDRYKEFIQIID